MEIYYVTSSMNWDSVKLKSVNFLSKSNDLEENP